MSVADTTRRGGGFWDRLRGLAGRVGQGGTAPRGAMPSYAMTDLLERGRVAGPRVSALDAVMGEDWAIVEAGRAGRAPVVRAGIAAAHRRDVARHGGGGGGRPGGRPQAVVKMIRRGGASDLRGLRAQMAYLSRDGAEPLQRSERYMGVELDAEQAGLLEQAWRMPEAGREGGADRTTHFIVSFPEGTPVGAAERAGRDWAEEMFGSGHYGGDSFDYYTAFHTDRAHPHLHVVVHRRGLEHGEWLKVSLRSDIHYDRMREVLVDVAAREGIELEATPRLARGQHDRVVPDVEYRRAGLERRDPVAPGHSPETALRAAAGLVHHARGMEDAARALELTDPAQAERLRDAGLHLGEGRALTPEVWGLPAFEPRTGEPAAIRAAAERELEAFARRDAEALEAEDPVERVCLMREIAVSKAAARPELGRHGIDLEAYTQPDDSGRYDGLAGTGPEDGWTAKMTNERIAGIAERHGVDGAATVARFSGGVPSRGLAQDFLIAEILERDTRRVEAGAPHESLDEALAANGLMHAEIDAVHALVRAGRSPHADVLDRMAARRAAERQRDARTPRMTTRDAAGLDIDAEDRRDGRRRAAEPDRLAKLTDEVRAKFVRLDAEADDLDDPAERMRVLREIADLKAATAGYMRDPGDLRPFAEPDASGRYAGVPGDDPVSARVREAADDVARDVAADYGVDPDATVARYSGPAPSRGLARLFAAAEARERAESRALSGAAPESPADRDAALAAMRHELRNVYDKARDIARERRAAPLEEDRDRDDAPCGLEGDPQPAPDREADRPDRTDGPEIAASGAWRDGGPGRGAVRDLAVRGWRGFHPAWSHAPGDDRDEITRSSVVSVDTPEAALALAAVLREHGDRRVMEIVAERKRYDREHPDGRRDFQMTPEQERFLRELERGNDRHRDRDDYDPF